MVPVFTFIAIAFTLLICFGLPIGLTIYFYRTRKISLLAVLIGAVTFLVMQVLLRIPLLGWFADTALYFNLTAYPVLLALFLGFTAALFEEGGRWLAFRFLLKGRLEHKNALAMGIGHGGFEAMYIVGLAYINYLVLAVMLNNGSFDSIIVPTIGEAAALSIRDVLLGNNGLLFMAAGVERALTIVIHIAFSVLVYLSVRYRKASFFWIAMAAHTGVDFAAVLASQAGWSTYTIEGLVAVFSAVGLWFLIRSHQIDQTLAGQTTLSTNMPEVIPPDEALE